MESAKMGISTAYGMPTKLSTPKRRSKARIGPVYTTYRNPSTTDVKGDP
jgi:hypothetical protein